MSNLSNDKANGNSYNYGEKKENSLETNFTSIYRLLEQTVEELKHIAKIPRGTKNMEGIRNYILKYAEKHGFEAHADTYGNVIIDVPATKGRENEAKVILQGHMDMVCKAADGKDFDFENNGITVIREGNILHADGTTLGADNGIAWAMISTIITSEAKHGPLRIVMTADEEGDMDGAKSLDKDTLDVKYMINLDYEEPNQICYGSAGGFSSTYDKSVTKIPHLEGDVVCDLSISGLLGGHSGADIHFHRMNSIGTMMKFLKQVEDSGIPVKLVNFDSGTAHNAIPSSGDVVFTVPSEKYGAVQAIFDAFIDDRKKEYQNETNFTAKLSTVDGEKSDTLTESDSSSLINLINETQDGVIAYMKDSAHIVETSANIAILKLYGDKVELITSTRSSLSSELLKQRSDTTKTAEKYGFMIDNSEGYKPWLGNKDIPLANFIASAYKNAINAEAEKTVIHAGLESSFISEINPDMQIVCIGPKISDPHTPVESVDLDTVASCMKVLLYALDHTSELEK